MISHHWKLATTTALGLIALSVAIPSNVSAASDWTDKVKFKGDFRYRYEAINEQGRDTRHRNRLRLRIGLQANVTDSVDVGAVLASGGEDPVSTNQTLDSQSTTKDIRLDQGYFAWKAAEGLTIKGGKFKNPFYRPVKSELLWDVDLRPEGMVLQYNKGLFANAGFFYVEERSGSGDSLLLGGQVGYKAKFGNTKLTIGTGYFDYTEIKGRNLNDFDFLSNEADSFGNTLDAGNNFITDYNEWELFGDVTIDAGMPIAFFVDYVVNTAAEGAAEQNDTGYLVGVKVGKAKNPGSWDFRYNYREIEADAVFGTFADSDFIGGGTDGKGHEINFGYQIAKGWKFAATYFINEKGVNNGVDYDRVQVDLKFKF